MLRAVLLLVTGLVLTACAKPDDVAGPQLDLGNFTLGHNVVVASKAETSTALGREVTEEQLTETMKEAISSRLDRYEGTKQYHLGVSVEGYLLARGGVPVVAAPKSAMIIRVTVWDDAKGEKLNVPPEQLTILEDIDGESLFSSGWLKTADVQLEDLAGNAADAIEKFLLTKNEERGWFESEEEAARRIEASEAAAAAQQAEDQNDAPPPARVIRPATEPETTDSVIDTETVASGA